MQLDVPVIGILRGIGEELFPRVMQASFVAGLQALEVTLNTPNAVQIIESNRAHLPQGKLLGMGTIRNAAEARLAIAAGAMFLVTPNTDLEVIEIANRHDIPVIAGAFTPSEVYRAWSAGASMVKVFPCPGPAYIKDLCGPFDDIPLVAVGGVTRESLPDFLSAGVAAVGIGDSLFGKAALKEQDEEAIHQSVKEYLSLIPA
jgi:2-dehydro-3-deoxyphosphogluconate aldolase/(4S)-4-hydroxy-2-oxoglutarate aldolase